MLIFLFFAAYLVILIAAIGMLIFAVWIAVIAPFRGSPYAPTRKREMTVAFDLAAPKSGELLIDLGCGDGAVLIAAAERGVRSRGVEINPFFVWYARWRIRRRDFGHLATVARGDMFEHPVADANVIFLYLVPASMERLSARLRREAAPGTRIITHLFDLPSWEPEERRGKISLYRA